MFRPKTFNPREIFEVLCGGEGKTIGHDFWLSLIGAVVIVAIFAPLTVRAYMRKA
jgi:hypothetical protein